MIAKRIDIEPENDNYERLADYIPAAPEKGEKLDDLWIVNCDAGEALDDLQLAKKEIKAPQALNQTAKSGKTYNLIGRKSGVEGKREQVSVDYGGRRIIKKKQQK